MNEVLLLCLAAVLGVTAGYTAMDLIAAVYVLIKYRDDDRISREWRAEYERGTREWERIKRGKRP